MPKSIMENPSINGSFQSPGPCVPRAPRAPRAPGGPRHPLPHSSPATSKPVHGMGKPLDLGRSENHQLVLLWPSNHWWKYIDIYIYTYIHIHTYIYLYIHIICKLLAVSKFDLWLYRWNDGMGFQANLHKTMRFESIWRPYNHQTDKKHDPTYPWLLFDVLQKELSLTSLISFKKSS